MFYRIKTTKAPTKKNVNVEENNEEEMICDSSSDSVQVTDVQVTEYTKKKDLFQGNAKSYDKQLSVKLIYLVFVNYN